MNKRYEIFINKKFCFINVNEEINLTPKFYLKKIFLILNDVTVLVQDLIGSSHPVLD